jgi:hypothetical protein
MVVLRSSRTRKPEDVNMQPVGVANTRRISTGYDAQKSPQSLHSSLLLRSRQHNWHLRGLCLCLCLAMAWLGSAWFGLWAWRREHANFVSCVGVIRFFSSFFLMSPLLLGYWKPVAIKLLHALITPNVSSGVSREIGGDYVQNRCWSTILHIIIVGGVVKCCQ